MLGLSVSYQRIKIETHEVEYTTTVARSLLTVDGIRFMFTGVVQNFMNFNAVGVIIVAMVGVGVAEEKGLIKALIRKLVIVAPPAWLSYIMVFVGILSSVAADAGYIVRDPARRRRVHRRRAASSGRAGRSLRGGGGGVHGQHPDRAHGRHPDRDHQRRDPPGQSHDLDRSRGQRLVLRSPR